MFGLGVPELVLILVIVVLVFGVGKLANVGGALGKSVREFRDAAGVNNESTSTTTKTVTNPDGSVTTVKDETKTQA